MHDATIEHPFKIWTQTTYDWNMMKRIKLSSRQETLMIEQPGSLRKVEKKNWEK